MIAYVKRLAKTGTAYTASSVLAKLFAVALLPLYTRHVTAVEYGVVETLLVTVVVLSIIFRLGAIEALLRFYHQGGKPRDEVLRTGFWLLLGGTTVGASVAFLFAGQLTELLLRGEPEVELMRIAVVGFWFFSLYEILLTFFRVEERAGAYATATVSNVLLTVPLTVWLVVFQDQGARGLLLGNFVGTAVIVVGLLAAHRRQIGRPGLPQARAMIAFGLPTMPAELSLYALNFADRVLLVWLADTPRKGLAMAGLYSIAFKFAQFVTVFVRAFQLAWPPLAYSIVEDREARDVYPRILTYYVLLTAAIVTALALVSRWIVQFLAAPSYFDAHKAVPFIACGVALYGAYLVLVAAVARKGDTRVLFPVALTALVVNVALGLVLIPAAGIAGAGLALIGAYVVIFGLMYLRARSILGLQLEWMRLTQIITAALIVSLAAELLLPSSGAVGLFARTGAWFGYPALLLAVQFFRPGELKFARSIPGRLRAMARSS